MEHSNSNSKNAIPNIGYFYLESLLQFVLHLLRKFSKVMDDILLICGSLITLSMNKVQKGDLIDE